MVAARLPARSEPANGPVLAHDGNRPDLVLDPIVMCALQKHDLIRLRCWWELTVLNEMDPATRLMCTSNQPVASLE